MLLARAGCCVVAPFLTLCNTRRWDMRDGTRGARKTAREILLCAARASASQSAAPLLLTSRLSLRCLASARFLPVPNVPVGHLPRPTRLAGGAAAARPARARVDEHPSCVHSCHICCLPRLRGRRVCARRGHRRLHGEAGKRGGGEGVKCLVAGREERCAVGM